MSDVLRHIEVNANLVNCYNHWEGTPAEWRVHLITGHCQFGTYSCDSLASHTVDFGFYADGGRVPVGSPLGVCDAHLKIVAVERISIQVSGGTTNA